MYQLKAAPQAKGAALGFRKGHRPLDCGPRREAGKGADSLSAKKGNPCRFVKSLRFLSFL